MEHLGHPAHLIGTEKRGDIQHDAVTGETPDQLAAELPFGVRHGNLYVDIRTPTGNGASLGLHGLKIVCKHFERNRPIRNRCKDLAPEPLIVGDARLAHERWVRCKSPDVGLGVEFHDAVKVRAICKDLYLEPFDARHLSLSLNQQTYPLGRICIINELNLAQSAELPRIALIRSRTTSTAALAKVMVGVASYRSLQRNRSFLLRLPIDNLRNNKP